MSMQELICSLTENIFFFNLLLLSLPCSYYKYNALTSRSNVADCNRCRNAIFDKLVEP